MRKVDRVAAVAFFRGFFMTLGVLALCSIVLTALGHPLEDWYIAFFGLGISVIGGIGDALRERKKWGQRGSNPQL